MRVYAATVALVAALAPQVQLSSGFVPTRVASSRPNGAVDQRQQLQRDNIQQSSLDNGRLRVLFSTTTEEGETTTSTATKKKKKLGLITFDLDDTLYPIAPVLDEANLAFSSAMSNFGYVGIEPSEIIEVGKEIRAQLEQDGEKEVKEDDPLRPATVNHKEIRLAAIRKEMEQFILKTKLQQTAEDWATEVDSLTTPVRNSAAK